MLLFGKKRPARTHRPQYARPAVEALESRLTPYAALGNAWPGPQLITISFVPDGTALGGSNVSNLFATMNARFGTASVWETQVLKAAQQWAQQTNINFALVSDDGSPAGSGAYEQGAPNFGDIRIGGYDFGNTNLGMAYQPPPVNNTSFAGDVNFNTGLTFSIGSGTDLFTAAVHEIGHALGLGHSAFSSSVMYASYNGVKRGLSSDDIAGIQSVYGGARARDAYGAGPTPNNTFATAANLNSAIDPTSLTALVTGLDITTTSTPAPGGTYAVTPDVDYYTFTAPTGASATGTLVLNVQSAGLRVCCRSPPRPRTRGRGVGGEGVFPQK